MTLVRNKGALDRTEDGRSINDGTNTRSWSPIPAVLGYGPVGPKIATLKVSCDQINDLKIYLKNSRMRQRLYKKYGNKAKSPVELDKLVNKEMAKQLQKAQKSGKIQLTGKQIAVGEVDMCSDEKVVLDLCKYENRRPLCFWLREGNQKHEDTHEKQRNELRKNYVEWRHYCSRHSSMSGKEKAKKAAEWEYEAYGEEIKVYEKILARMKKERPDCFRIKP